MEIPHLFWLEVSLKLSPTIKGNVSKMDAHICQLIQLGNSVKQEKEATHEGLKNPPRASNRALNQ